VQNKELMTVQKHIDSGERVFWSGKPKQGLIFRGADIFIIPFSLFWCGFVFFWEYSVISHGAPIFFPLFGIPFVAVGIYLIIGRFYVDAKKRENTFYAVTSERVMIISGVFRQKLKSLALRTLSEVSVDESKDGSGSIEFGQSLPFASLLAGIWWPGLEQFSGPRFDAIHNPKEVYQLIREQQKDCT